MFEDCEDQVPLITNVDEVLARLTVVLHSNDPVARAVTLRCAYTDRFMHISDARSALGCMAFVTAQRPQVQDAYVPCLQFHHSVLSVLFTLIIGSVQNSLSSPYEEEVASAMAATDRMCQRSSLFCRSIIGNLSSKLLCK